MKKLLYLILLLPLWVNAQTNGTIQKTSATGNIRGSFGSLGIDTLTRVTGALVDGYILKYHAATNKWYAAPDAYTSISTGTISNTPDSKGLSYSSGSFRLHAVTPTTGGVLTNGIDSIGGDKYFADQIWITENQQYGGHIGIVSASGSLMAPLLGASSESSSNWLEILAHPAPNLYGTNPTDGIKFQVFNDEGPNPITAGNAYNFKNGSTSLFNIGHSGDSNIWGGLSLFDNAASNGAISLGSGSGSLLAPTLGANSETSLYWFRFAGNPATNIDNTNPTDAFRFDAYKNKDTNVAMDGGNLLNLYNNNVTKFKVDWDGVTTAKSLNLTGLTASASVATDGSKNLVSVTNTGSGNNVLATSPTFTTGTTITTGTNGILNGSTSNYGYTSFNGSTSLTGMTGIFGGASGDAATLYHQAPTGGLHDFRVAGTDALTLTETVATFSSLAGTGTRMVVASNTGAISTQAIPGGGGGSVTGVAVGTSNGFAGTSDGNAVVPTLTLTTTVNGMAKGNGTALSAATANTDYTLLNGTGLVSVNGSTTPVYNTTSSSISGIISDETGSGSMVFGTSPTLTTPNIGNATAGTINASGTITSTLGNNTVLYNAATATTGYQYANIQNTSGHIQLGIEGSSAGTLLTGGSAYAGIITTVGTKNLELGTDQILGLKIDGTNRKITMPELGGAGDVIVGADNNGLLGEIAIGSGLSLTAGVLTATGGSSGSVTTAGGTAGRIAKFTSASNIENSIMTESSGLIDLAGDLTLSGTITTSDAVPFVLSSPTTIDFHQSGSGTVRFVNNTFGAVNMSLNNSGDMDVRGALSVTGAISGSNLSGTNTGDQTTITGNAGTATALQTARNIQGVSFNGTTDINPINGTGFVKASGTTLSYDNNTYLTTSTASSTYAPLASPALTGNPTAPTQTAGDNSTKIATTAYVDGAISTKVVAGTFTFSGTGSQTVFTQDSANSTGMVITPTSADASGAYYLTSDNNGCGGLCDRIIITFLTAPASGTNNITFNYIKKN